MAGPCHVRRRRGRATIRPPTCTIATVDAPIEPRAERADPDLPGGDGSTSGVGFPQRTGRTSDAIALESVGLLGLVTIALGLTSLASGPMGFDGKGVVAGIASQLPTTLPAAILVLGASALNLGAGAVLARLARRAAFGSLGEAILAAFVATVLLDVVLLLGLGGIGRFSRPAVLVA